MKLWIKYLLGCIIGIAAAYLIPDTLMQDTHVLSVLTELALRTGRYILVPVLFFSVTVGVCYLRESRMLIKTTVSVVLITVFSTLLFTALGLASVLIVRMPRIPISVDRVSQSATLGIADLLLKLFPWSGFESLIDGVFLLPMIVFACFAGVGCSVDRNASKPTVTLFDSLASVCSIIMSFFIDLISIGLIAISCTWALTWFQVFSSGLYNSLIILLAVNLAIIGLVLYPILVRLICKERHPYRVLYAGIAPLLTAFFSGDTNLSLAVATRPIKESLGVRRRCGNYTLPLFSIFARGGTALVTSVSFIIILRSYSSLGIAFGDILWIGGVSCFCSLFLGGLPTGGAYTALMVMCAMYGRGFEAGYLLIRPVAPIIGSFACAIDALTMLFGTFITANKLGMAERRDIHFFI